MADIDPRESEITRGLFVIENSCRYRSVKFAIITCFSRLPNVSSEIKTV